VSRRKAKYRARIHKSDIGRFMVSGWDIDPDAMPSGGMVTIVWYGTDRPSDMPPGCEVIGGVWQ
jgi:hypothetical protein